MGPKDLGSLAFKIAGVIVIAQALLLLPDLLSIPGFPQYTDDKYGLNVPLIVMGHVIPIVLLLGLGIFLISSSRRLTETTILDGAVETRLNAVTVHAILLSVIGAFLVGYAAGDVPSVIRDFSIAKFVEEVDPYQNSRHWAWSLGTLLQLLIGIGLIVWAKRMAAAFHPLPSEPVVSPSAAHCPHCGYEYEASDYRPDASTWLCSKCGRELVP